MDDGRRREARQFTHGDSIPPTADVRAKLAELKARFVTEAAIRDQAYQQFGRLAPLLGRIELGSMDLAIASVDTQIRQLIDTSKPAIN